MPEGTLHRHVMRRATAADEILPLKDPRVQKNPAYLVVILLSRVVTRLGGGRARSRRNVIEATLLRPTSRTSKTLYNAVNRARTAVERRATCPGLSRTTSRVEDPGLREAVGYPARAGSARRVAYVAYHFHWSQAELLAMEHRERRRWVGGISSINERMNGSDG